MKSNNAAQICKNFPKAEGDVSLNLSFFHYFQSLLSLIMEGQPK